MPDVSNKSEDAMLLAKLEKLEQDIIEIDRAKNQQTIIIRVGLLLIVLALGLFALNLWKFYKEMTREEKITELTETVTKDMQELFVNDQNLQAFQKDIVEKVIPNVSQQVLERLQKELPVFRQKGEKILDNLKNHVSESMKVKLTGALDSAIKDIELEVLKEYPDVSAEKLENVFKQTENVFIEHITNMLEKKIELVDSDLEQMEKTLDKFAKIAEQKKFGTEVGPNERLELAKLDFIENILELAIYTVNSAKTTIDKDIPEIGNMPAVETEKGGVK